MHKRKGSSEIPLALRLLTIEQVANVMGVGKDKVYDLIKNQGLPAFSLSAPGTRPKLRVAVTSLERWIQEREQHQIIQTGVRMNVRMNVRKSRQIKKAVGSPSQNGGENTSPTSKQGPSQAS